MSIQSELVANRRGIYIQLHAVNLGLLINVALALLALKIFDSNTKIDGDTIARALGSFAVALWIVMEYFTFAMAQDRYLSWLDALSQYLLGACQTACCVLVLDREAWLNASFTMIYFGSFAYFLQLPLLNRGALLDPRLKKLTTWNAIIGIAFVVLSYWNLDFYERKAICSGEVFTWSPWKKDIAFRCDGLVLLGWYAFALTFIAVRGGWLNDHVKELMDEVSKREK